jgi:hypothetical protein
VGAVGVIGGTPVGWGGAAGRISAAAGYGPEGPLDPAAEPFVGSACDAGV